MIIISEALPAFHRHLLHQEASANTMAKYLRDVRLLGHITGDRIDCLEQLLQFKSALQQRGYAVRSINSMISAVNQFVCFCGHPEWKLRLLKWQRTIFVDEKHEIRQQEYQRLVNTAMKQGRERLALILQTLCATGIRVSEIRAITVASLRSGMAEICSKGKIRTILLPRSLCEKLLDYCARRGIRTGCIFITRSGRVMDRSNIWRQMKRLHAAARVRQEKIFPHNLRHLFACCFYQKFKDVVRLADILGHSSVDTTRIYTARSTAGERRRMELLGLVVGQRKKTT